MALAGAVGLWVFAWLLTNLASSREQVLERAPYEIHDIEDTPFSSAHSSWSIPQPKPHALGTPPHMETSCSGVDKGAPKGEWRLTFHHGASQKDGVRSPKCFPRDQILMLPQMEPTAHPPRDDPSLQGCDQTSV